MDKSKKPVREIETQKVLREKNGKEFVIRILDATKRKIQAQCQFRSAAEIGNAPIVRSMILSQPAEAIQLSLPSVSKQDGRPMHKAEAAL